MRILNLIINLFQKYITKKLIYKVSDFEIIDH